jgi:predicted nucleic acid-binding protein
MIVLDTNVSSELIRHFPDAGVVEWVDSQESSDIVTTAIARAELRAGRQHEASLATRNAKDLRGDRRSCHRPVGTARLKQGSAARHAAAMSEADGRTQADGATPDPIHLLATGQRSRRTAISLPAVHGGKPSRGAGELRAGPVAVIVGV